MNTQHHIAAIGILAGIFMSISFVSLSYAEPSADNKYYPSKIKNFAIEQPFGGYTGNAERGRKIVINRDKGNCLACHSFPIDEEAFHGTVGPSLHGIASRLNEAQIRLRVADQQKINPMTIMPGFYKNPKENNRVADSYWGQPVLSAQETEDVIAYLMTLK